MMIFWNGLKHDLCIGEKVIADWIYGYEAPLEVRAQGTTFQNNTTKMWRTEYMLCRNTATDG